MTDLNSQGKDLVTINYKEIEITLKSGERVTLQVTEEKLTEDIVITSELPDVVEEWDGSYTVLVEEPIQMISFTLGGTSYEVESGMTWGEFIDSEYNPDTPANWDYGGPKIFYADGSNCKYYYDSYNSCYVTLSSGGTEVLLTDVIEPITYHDSCTGGGMN